MALVYALVLFARGHPYDIDHIAYFLPHLTMVGDAYAHGELPLWGSSVWAGFPLLAEGQAGVFSPLQLVWVVAGDAFTALELQRTVALLLAALSGAWAGRLLGYGHAASALSGVVWSLGGGLLAYQDNQAVLATCLVFPLVLACGLRRRLLACSALLAFSLLSGHPYFYALAFVIAALAWIAGAAAHREEASLGPALARGLGMLALGAALGAIQWVPTAELVLHSDRAAEGMSSIARQQATLRPFELLYLVSPVYPSSLRYSSGSGVLAYVGVLATVLAGLGVSAGARELHVRLLAALGGVSVVLALLASTSAGEALSSLPLLGLIRGPSKLLVLVGLALALLAGRGLGALTSVPLRWVLVILVALDLGWYGQRKADPIDREALRAPPRVAERVGSGARLRVAGTQGLWGNEIPTGEAAQAALYESQPLDPSCGVVWGVDYLDGYTPLRLPRTLRVCGGVALARLQRAATTHVVLHPHLGTPPGLELVERQRRWALFRVPGTLPRAYACTGARVVSDLDAALSAVDGEPLGRVVLEGPAGEAAAAKLTPGTPPAVLAVEVSSWRPGRIELTLALGAPAIVVVADSFYPGWEVELDGEPAALLHANAAFKGVAVKAGSRQVVFSYRPASFTWGAGLSLLSALCAVGGLAWRRRSWEDPPQ